MTKRNKLRYQVHEKPKVTITLTSSIFLQYYNDEEDISQAQKGDMLVYPNNDALNTTQQGEYEKTGFSGYFKVDVSDGKTWQPLLLNDIFKNNENHFSKSERPIDTYKLCLEILREKTGAVISRTYREHYKIEE